MPFSLEMSESIKSTTRHLKYSYMSIFTNLLYIYIFIFLYTYPKNRIIYLHIINIRLMLICIGLSEMCLFVANIP